MLEADRLVIVFPVWGRDYLALFRDCCLPSLLFPGNLPAAAATKRTLLRIYTTEEGRSWLRADEQTRSVLGQVIATGAGIEVRTIETDRIGLKYNVVSTIARQELSEAVADRSAVMPLYPDALWSDGCLVEALRRGAGGARAVFTWAPRLTTERALPMVRARLAEPTPLTNREIVRIALRSLHPMFVAQAYSSASSLRHCSALWWPVGSTGLVCRSFHLHPIYISPLHALPARFASIDNDAPGTLIDHPRDGEIVTDSDSMVMVSFTPEAEGRDVIRHGQPQRLEELVEFNRRVSTDVHWDFFSQAIEFHTDGKAGADWQPVRAQAEAACRAMLDMRGRSM